MVLGASGSSPSRRIVHVPKILKLRRSFLFRTRRRFFWSFTEGVAMKIGRQYVGDGKRSGSITTVSVRVFMMKARKVTGSQVDFCAPTQVRPVKQRARDGYTSSS